MTSEQWHKVKEITADALDREPLERLPFVLKRCGDDEEVLREVLRLLKEAETTGPGFSPVPVWDVHQVPDWQKVQQPPFPPDPDPSLFQGIGSMLAHYRIEAKVGEGGMGVVFRAHDTRLDRTVAIKVLPLRALSDADGRRRFVREARAASALNHPNIVTIYDINHAEVAGRTVDYIAMEYVPGQTLRTLIGRKGLEVRLAVSYAMQIADALATAHAAGIVHRDIKPANVMVTGLGLVKVLDFGVAKLIEMGDTQECDPIQTIGQDTELTSRGAVVGTAAYMSPEQAKGRRVDARTDIFSFGAVLFEMVTGQRAFSGENVISSSDTLLHRETPPLSKVDPRLTGELEKIITRCLRKDREYRYQRMADVKTALHEIEEKSGSGGSTLRFAEWRTWVLISCGCALLATAGLISRQFDSRASEPFGIPQLTRLTSDSGLTTDPAISPDGKLLVYSSDRTGEGNLSLWVQQTGGGQPIRLTFDNTDSIQPDFAPDSSQVVFRSERDKGGIYVISTRGGEAQLIAPYGRNPHFSPDGSRIVYWLGDRQTASDIYVVPAAGGQPTPLVFHPDIRTARYPIWSPDGKFLMFFGSQGLHPNAEREPYDWWVASVETGAAFKTEAFAALEKGGLLTSYMLAPGAWLKDRVLFCAGTRRQSLPRGHIPNPNESANLWQIGMSGRNWRFVGPPTRLTFGTDLTARLSVANTGQVVFSSLSENLDLWSLPTDTSMAKVQGPPERLTQDAAADAYPSITADGKRLVFWSDRSGNADIWMKDLESGLERRLTVDPAYETFPVVSPDGSRFAFWSVKDPKPPALFLAALSGDGQAGPAHKVCDDCGNLSDLAADGRTLSYGDKAGIVSVNSSTGQKTPEAKARPGWAADPRFSPDGRWIAFHTIESAVTRRIYVAPAPGIAGPWIPITAGTSMERLTAWSPDGGVLYFISDADGFRCIAARRLDRQTKQPVGDVFYVYHFHNARRSMMSLINVNMARLSVARNKIVFTLDEQAGNIWTMKVPAGRVSAVGRYRQPDLLAVLP